MFRFTGSEIVNRPAPTVWAFLIDFPKVPTWEGGVLEVRQTSSGAPGVGTTFVARRRYGPRESLVDCRLTDWQEGRSATMSIRGGPIQEALVTYAVEPAGEDRSRVTYRAEGALRGPMRFLTLLMPAIGRAQTRKNLRSLKRMLEGS